jgi:hypothetical protein
MPATWALERADPALVEQVLRDARVERRLAETGWSEYVLELALALRRAIADSLDSLLRLPPGARAGVKVAAITLAGLVVLLALAWAMRAWLARRRPAAAGPGDVSTLPRAAAQERGPEAWGAELAHRLGRGEAGAALEALWWWLATSITDGRVDPAWTSQELVLRCHRPQLLPHVRVLDRLTYGGRRAELEEVRHLASRLREALA